MFQLPVEHRLLRESVRALAEKEIAPHAATADETARFPTVSLAALVRNRMHAVHIPREYGGEGADALAACLVVEEVARCCASTSLIPSVTRLATLPLLEHGSAEQKQRYLGSVARDGAAFSFALSEPEAGSDAAAIRARARRDGDGYVLTGSKRWISNAGVSRYYTVFAVTAPDAGAGGISAFVVHDDDEGFVVGRSERKMGLRGSPTRDLYFDNCRIPADRLIGTEGTGLPMALAALNHSRITIAAQAVGIAQGALDLATRYVTERQQFRRSLAEFQGVGFMLADMAMRLAAARQLTYTAAAASERDDPRLAFLSSSAKCVASDAAVQITTDAVQLLGGAGYTRDFPAERMMRDAKATQIYEGTNQIQRVIIAREVVAGRAW